MQHHTVQIPDECHSCGLTNFNVTGLRQSGETSIRVTCMRCGKPQHHLIHTPPA